MKFFHHKNIIFSYTIFLLLGWVSLTSAHEVNKGAVALLIAKNETGKTVGTGSGFVVQPDGTLVTNYHVLVDAHSVKAYFPNGTQVDVIGIRNIDRVRDFAVLELAKGFYSTLELGDSTSLQAYDYTSALGYLSENVKENNGTVEGIVAQTYGFVLGIHPQAIPDVPFIIPPQRLVPVSVVALW